MNQPWEITRHEPSLLGVLIALFWLPVVALACGIGKLGEWLTRGKANTDA